jgi:hypothetical protein
MRKLIAAAVAAVSLAAVTATTAGAQTATKFSVRTASPKGHETSTGFVAHGRLAEVGDPSETVGSYKLRFSGPHLRHLRSVFVFPDGKIKAVGNPNHNKTPIVGGTGRWNGASGKVKVTNLPGLNVILTFTVVQ